MKSVCVLLALSLTGCSLFMTRGPSDTGNPPRAYPSCTTSMGYPIADTVIGGLFLASAVTTAAGGGATSNDKDTRTASATTAALFAALFGVSAYVGYSRVSRCRNAEDNFQRAYPNGMPYGYGYYPQQYPQPYPQQYPAPYPQPAPAPQPTPTTAPAPPTPQQQPGTAALGTEGDVCTSSAECATGLTCAANVCVRPPSKK